MNDFKVDKVNKKSIIIITYNKIMFLQIINIEKYRFLRNKVFYILKNKKKRL